MLDSACALRALSVLLASATALSAQVVGTIAQGNASNTVTSMSSWRRSVVLTATGTLWALVRDNANGNQLYLTSSVDGGATWTGRFDVPTTDDGAGAIAADRVDCGILHVAWNALDGGSWQDVYHAEFDVAAGFVGTPTKLTNATGSNDQYFADDVATTPDGSVVVAMHTHRAPASGSWTSGWSAGLFHRRPGQSTFDPVQQVNTDSFGIQIDLQPVGNVVHAAFRTNTGLYGIRYRAYDTTIPGFTTGTDIQVATGTSNSSQIAATANGDLYVLHSSGGTSAGSGELRMAWLPAGGGGGGWTSQPVTSDPDLLRGNVSHLHFSLATDGTDAAYAIYSKVTGEQHRNLYFRVFQGGQAVTTETPVATSNDPDRYRIIAGVRNPSTTGAPMAIVESRAAVHPGNLLEFLRIGAAGRAETYGSGCRGNLANEPRLAVGAQPLAGTTLPLEWSDAPANAPAALLFGAACRRPALDLTAFGFTGCRLWVDAPGSAGLVMDGQGRATVPLAIPANPSYAGLPFQLQSIVLAAGANAGGAVLTAPLAVVVD